MRKLPCKLGRPRGLQKAHRSSPLTLNSLFLWNSSFWLCLATQHFFFFAAFVEFLGRCLPTLLLCLRPALGWGFYSVFQPDPEKRKHSLGSPPQPAPVPAHLWPWRGCWCTQRPRPALHSSLPRPLHRSREPSEQRKGLSSRLPKSTGSLHTKNGETRFHLVL